MVQRALTRVLLPTIILSSLLGSASAASYPIKADGVNCRSGPGTSYSVVKSYTTANSVTLTCYSTGTSVSGNVYWDKTSDGCFVSDYYVKTGSSTPVVAKCGSTTKPGCAGINDAGVALIKEFEGYQKNPYKDPVGLWTVGYGHLCGGGKDSSCSDTGFSYPLTEATATALLKKDLPNYTTCLRDNLNASKVKLNQNQWAALTSFVFNLGCGNFRSSSLMTRLNNGEAPNTVIAQELPKWNKAGGSVLAGLTRRRAAEVTLAKTATTAQAFPTCS